MIIMNCSPFSGFRSVWLGEVFLIFLLLSAFSMADEVESTVTSRQDGGIAKTDTLDCDDSEVVDMQRRASFKSPEEFEPARQDAIRLALIDALQNVAGADIARSTQTSTTSTRSSLERKTREHLVLRSDGRVVAWKMLSEDISDDSDGSGVIDIVIQAEICIGEQTGRPIVVALEELNNGLGAGASELRYRLADLIGSYDRLSVVYDPPQDVYHDIKITFDHSLDVDRVDNSSKARILQEMGGSGSLPEEALKFELVTARATVVAVRFFDQETISETATRRLRRPLGAQRRDDVSGLLVDAFIMAGRSIGERLDAGDLNY